VFASRATALYADDPLAALRDAGICVAYMPDPASLADIREAVSFLAAATGTARRGEEVLAKMDAEVDAIRKAAAAAAAAGGRPAAYFEIQAAPSPYSVGGGTCLDELIGIAGGENVFGGEDGVVAVQEADVAGRDPQVILTNVGYLDDPVAEIKARPGLAGTQAVQGGRVYRVDSFPSTFLNENVTVALRQMAEALHPGVAAALGG
jgi:iron complex transport system substrate-binding protein